MATRRAFLRSGGAAVAGFVLFGCGDDDGDGSGDGTAAGLRTGSLTAGDIDLLAATARMEHSMRTAYVDAAAARAGDLWIVGATALVDLLRDHHDDAAATLNELLAENGAATVPDGDGFEGMALPDADDLARDPIADWLAAARDLEHRLVQTAITTVPRLSLGSLRQEVMAIAAGEARHVAALDLLLGGGLAGYGMTAARLVAGSYPTDASFLLG